MTAYYDAILIGAGHNGLVAANYLAKSGLRVIVLEKRGVPGGACVTEEVWPGFKISRLSYAYSLFRSEILKDLQLERHGFSIVSEDPASSIAQPPNPPTRPFRLAAYTWDQ